MTIYIGADHRGFGLKNKLIEFLKNEGCEVLDLGAFSLEEGDDYPDYANLVAERVSETGERGIVICGSGAGADIVANKHKGIRAVLAVSAEQAEASKNDDDTNILSLAADYISEEEAENIAMTWLRASFSGEERHKRRLEKISMIEAENFSSKGGSASGGE